MAVYTMSAYPKVIDLPNGEKITVRPMVADDEAALLNFFLKVSENDRFYLKEDVTSPKVVGEWAEHLNYGRALPLIALDGDRIIADGTLHRRRAGSMKHRGEIRIVVDAEYRSRGIGTALMHELIDIARDSDLEKLTFELVADEQDSAIQTAEALGFVRLATLPNYIKDMHGKPHDLLVLELPLGKWQEWWEF